MSLSSSPRSCSESLDSENSIELYEEDFWKYQVWERLDKVIKNGPWLNRVVLKTPQVELH